MSFQNRYSTTTNGAVTFTGNTLGLSNTNTIYSDIGAFITLDTTKQVTGYPPGSTQDWRENGSAARLQIPTGATVLYAELIWGGSTKTSTEDVTSEIDGPITFTSPASTYTITPDVTTAQQVTQANQTFYVRSANVTSLVNSDGAGTYTVSGVPATVQRFKSNNVAGWTLQVVYQDASLPLRNMNVYVGTASIERAGAINQSITGFSTSDSGPVNARLLVTAMEGDSRIPGDQLLFGKDASSLSPVSGPNNPVDNFFASQINDDDGNLDTSGTDGSLNVTPGNAAGAVRYSWDITNVDVSAAMENSQTDAVVQFTSKSDGYIVTGLGVQIDVNSPEIKVTKEVDKRAEVVGEILTYTIFVENSGLTEAQNTILKDTLPPEVSFIPGSLLIDGIPRPSDDPTAGVNIGSVSIEGPIEVVFQVKVNKVPPDNLAVNKASVIYDFQSGPGLPTSTGTAESNEATTVIRFVQVEVAKKEDVPVYNRAGNTILYTIEIDNTGDTDITNVVIEDIIPNGTKYVAGSLQRDGVPISGDIESGVNIGSVEAGKFVQVTFEVEIDSPEPERVDNKAKVQYEYELIPGDQVFEKDVTTNEVTATLVKNCKEAQKQILGKIGEDELAIAGQIVAEKVKIQDTIRSIFAGTKDATELLSVNQSLNNKLQRVILNETALLATLNKGKKLCCT
ncbi:DUF11 domain-containing protein [Shimazuella kribbensis]|uniref:DUF11 domain-containing protein n=1 Tax=Shimazuella kribbensis TaxID=139808 RepID=UPI00040C167B